MIIKELKYSPLRLNIKTPFQTSNHIFSFRDIIIIKLTDENNNSGFGEIAPLQHWGVETYEESLSKTAEISGSTRDLFVAEDIASITKMIESLSDCRTVKFGISQAILQLLLKRGMDIKSIFGKQPNKLLSINGVIGIQSLQNTIKEAKDLYKSGIRTIKLKVGSEKFENDYLNVEKIHREFNGEIKLRLDVNGKWNYDEACLNLSKLSEFPIEYIEQPVADTQELLILASNTDMNLAPDESIKSFDDIDLFIDSEKNNYLVIKPTLLGNIFLIIEKIKKAEKSNKKIIISSTFESDIGKSALLFLAAIVNHNCAHGLAVQEIFKDPPVPSFIKHEDGNINFDNINFSEIGENIPGIKWYP